MRGVLEGIFAQGQVYVLVSRVTDRCRINEPSRIVLCSVRMCTTLSHLDPRNFELLGIPPIDMLEQAAEAWRREGLDVAECLRRAVTITNDFVYEPEHESVLDRIQKRRSGHQRVPVRLRDLCEILNPQPEACRAYRVCSILSMHDQKIS